MATTKKQFTSLGHIKGLAGCSMRVVSADEKSDAQICRENGWKVGTRLVGDEGYGPTVIELTAIGERSIMAKRISHNGVPDEEQREGSWGLDCREWSEVKP